MRSIPVWYLLLVPLLGLLRTGGNASSIDDGIRLSVSISEEAFQGCSSCIQTLGNVELRNLDPTEPIIIRSIKQSSERFSAQSSGVAVPVNGWQWDAEVDSDPHFNVHLDSDGITLAPNQVTRLPISFFPFYPSFVGREKKAQAAGRTKHSNRARGKKKKSRHQDTKLQSSSKVATNSAASLLCSSGSLGLDCKNVEAEQDSGSGRSNLSIGDAKITYHVEATLVIDTSRGIFEKTVSGSSTRDNKYGIPDTIMFFDDSPVDCYDVHLSNPSTDRLRINAVEVSDSELVTMRNEPIGNNEMSDRPDPIRNGSNVKVPRVVPPESEDNYIVTICVDGVHLSSTDDDIDLGHLIIRTDVDDLFVMLERAVDYVETPAGESEIKLESDSESAEDDYLDYADQPLAEESDDDRFQPSSISLLRSTPARANLQVVASLKKGSHVRIGLTNHWDHPVKIVNAQINVNATGNTIEELLLNVGIRACVPGEDCETRKGQVSNIFTQDPIPPGETTDLLFSCAVASESSKLDFSPPNRVYSFNGTLTVHGSSNVSLSHEEWLKQGMMEPALSSQIPFTIVVTDGKIDFVLDEAVTHDRIASFYDSNLPDGLNSLSALFFSINDKTGERDSSRRTRKGVERRVKVLSPVPISLSRKRTKILQRKHPDDKNMIPPTANSSCNDFHITSFSSTRTKMIEPKESGLYEAGTITIKYFPNRTAHETALLTPKSCFLVTSANHFDNEYYYMNLMLYSSSLDVSTEDSFDLDEANVDAGTGDASGGQESTTTTISSGMERVLSRVRSSSLGSRIKRVLERMYKDTKEPLPKMCAGNATSGSEELSLLCRYLVDVSGSSVSSKSYLSPILLEHGAIGHGEMQTTSLLFTNRNPMPIKLNVDVKEVQGMSVTLARDVQEKSDGSVIFDYLPPLQNSSRKEAKAGKWAGHSLDGLRQFLLNSELAHSLSARFTQRDAITLSHQAVSEEPFLRKLYGVFAQVHLHSNDIVDCPPTSYRHCGSDGPLLQNPSRLKCFRAGTPVLISMDEDLVHCLDLCTDGHSPGCFHDQRVSSKPSSIVIPPGGTARLEVRILGLPKEDLQKDVAPFLASGLVLSTNFGQVIPIVSVYEALVGQLLLSGVAAGEMLSHNGSRADIENHASKIAETVVDVPSVLFGSTNSYFPGDSAGTNTSTLLTIPKVTQSDTNATDAKILYLTSNEHSLYLASTFSCDMILKTVQSSDPWFMVVPTERENETKFKAENERAVEVGSLLSVVSCLPNNSGRSKLKRRQPDQLPTYPSFYQCALNWLEGHPLLQSHTAGLSSRPYYENENHDADEKLKRVTAALQDVVSYLNLFYWGAKKQRSVLPQSGQESNSIEEETDTQHTTTSLTKTGVRVSDGTIPSNKVVMFAEVSDAWRALTEAGLHRVKASLRATIAYSYPGENSGAVCDEYDAKGKCAVRSNTSSTDMRSLSVAVDGLTVQSSLETPKLFDPSRAKQRTRIPKRTGDEVISVLDFPPTLVANTAALTIPLQNPTAVPVRVRLSAAPPSTDQHTNSEESMSKSKPATNVMDRYLEHNGDIYVQNQFSGRGVGGVHRGRLWWEGGGSFFVHDDKGNLIQSHHNVTIKAGAGAHVCLVNPSLHASSAFVMGCGSRCGDSETPKAIDNLPREISPIGASSAFGATLLGRPSLSSQLAGNEMYEPQLSAGGAPPQDAGPSPFAIPYSSLDEIIIPPYGQAELGPVFFRPPGRRSILGCDFPVERSGYSAEGVPKECLSKYFESMVFLENSLTGLERVIVRGKALWERVVFLDAPSEEDDDYGDLENRYGRTTLVFPGSNRKSDSTAVTKKVVVHNAGDVPVEFGAVYFSDAAVRGAAKTAAASLPLRLTPGDLRPSNGCEFRDFRLVGCRDEDSVSVDGERKEKTRNLRDGFRLLPGKNRTLLIEHRPECTFQKDYVTLNLAYNRSYSPLEETGFVSVSPAGRLRQARTNHREGSFKKQRAEIYIGFEMTDSEMDSCISFSGESEAVNPILPVSGENTASQGTKLAVGETNKTVGQRSSESSRDQGRIKSRERYQFFGIIISFFLLCTAPVYRGKARDKSQVFFRSVLIGKHRHRREQFMTENSPPDLDGNGTTSLWSAAFKCLARADPSSSDLQILGREQVRQVVLNRYKSMGMLPPQCINSSGGFQRERPGSGAGAVAKGNAKEGSVGGGEKMRTLSDAIFHKSAVSVDSSKGSRVAPFGLDWRAAIARGVVNPSYMAHAVEPELALEFPVLAKNRNLALERSRSETPHDEQESGTRETAKNAARPPDQTRLPLADETKVAQNTAMQALASTSDGKKAEQWPQDPNEGSFIKHGSKQNRSKAVDSKKKDNGMSARKPPATSAKKVPQTGDSRARDGRLVASRENSSNRSMSSSQSGSRRETKSLASGQDSRLKNGNNYTDSKKNVAQRPSMQRERVGWADPAAVASIHLTSTPSRGNSNQGRSTGSTVIGGKEHWPALGGDKEIQASVKVASSKTIARPSPGKEMKSQSTPPTEAANTVVGSSRPPTSPTAIRSPIRASGVGSPPLSMKPSVGTIGPPGMAPPPGFFSSNTSDSSSLDMRLAMPYTGPENTTGDDVSSVQTGSDGSTNESNGLVSPFPGFSTISSPRRSSPRMSASPSSKRVVRNHSNDLDFPVLSSPYNSKTVSVTSSGSSSNQSFLAPGAPTTAPPPADSQPLLGLGGGFNVVDFLGDILNEASQPVDAQETDNSAPLAAPSLFPSSKNERKSRAAAYGIAVEETNDDAAPTSRETHYVQAMMTLSPERKGLTSGDEVDQIVSSIPLLTPADIMGARAVETKDNNNDRQQERYVFNPHSFHASLLGE